MRLFFLIFMVNFLLGANVLDIKKINFPSKTIKKLGDVRIIQGGYGSSIYFTKKDEFYTLSDNSIKSPQINHFKLKNEKIIPLKSIRLKNTLNPEGLVVLKDNTFWICDEDSMDLIHLNKNSKEIKRIDFLPHELKLRAKNKGFEGLAISKDEKILTAIVQSSLKNPNKKAKKSDLTRIVSVNLRTKKIKQFLYRQEKIKHSNSEIHSLGDEKFLVLERNSKNTFKKIFKISLKNATDIQNLKLRKNMLHDKKHGLILKNKTLEEFVLKHGWKKLRKHGIFPIKKELFLDLDKLNYPHDKPEGLFMLDKHTLVLINDDDFAIRKKYGKIKQKHMKNNKIDFTELFIIKGDF